MSRKMRKVRLSFPHPDPRDPTGDHPIYYVERADNQITHLPGQFLRKADVEALLEMSWWDVTIVPIKGA